MPTNIGRTPEDDRRTRRALSRLANRPLESLGVTGGPGIGTSGTQISVVFGPLPGLGFASGGITIILDPNANNMASITGGGLLVLSPLTTKGDLFVYTTEYARLPVGTNGQVLTADSAQAAGMRWADPTGGTAALDFDEEDVSEMETCLIVDEAL